VTPGAGRPPSDRVRAIFVEARSRAAADREAFLERACAGDAALLAEVTSLLRSLERVGSFLESTPVGEVVRARADDVLRTSRDDPSPPAALPERIGRYRVVRLLGEGGMGAVYEAEQETPRRRVAVKVLHSAFASPGLRRRFEREIEVLGRLQHPGIAHVHEAGMTEPAAGSPPQPFLVMEIVDGVPITDHARAAGLDTRGRMELLARTCDAVEHAHARGIVHRDLKPANVLVTPAGEPKVLDFGVARSLHAEALGPSLRTMTGQLIGTLAYMSPEQVEGRPEDVDTRADVHALGVIAFELLTGRLPHDLGRVSPAEAIRILREEEAAHLASADRRLRGDLDTIVAKALDRDRARRYGSAGALASDIRRWLRDEPVAARPPSAAYQLRKFARRNKALVGGALVGALALVAGTIVATTQAVVARRAAEAARREAYRAGLAAAASALEDGDVIAARRHLRAAPAATRGWEWRYLDARLDDSVLRLEDLDGPVAVVADGDDGSVVGLEEVGGARRLRRWDRVTGHRVRGRDVDATARPVIARADDLPFLARAVYFHEGERAIEVLDASSRRALAVLRSCAGDAALSTVVAAGRRVAYVRAVSGAGQACACDLATGAEVLPCLEGPGTSNVVAVSGDDRLVAIGGGTGEVPIFDTATGARVAVLPGRLDTAWALAFRPDGAEIAVGTQNAHLSTWDVRTARLIGEQQLERAGGITALAWSPDGAMLASAARDTTIRIWDGALARQLAALDGHEEAPWSLAFRADGAELYSSASDGSTRVWAMGERDEARVLRGHSSYVYGVAMAAEDSLLVSGAWDGTVRAWDVGAAAAVATLAMPEGASRLVLAVAVRPDGSGLAASCDGGFIGLFSAASGRLVASQGGGPSQAAHALAFSPDGAVLAASTSDRVELLDASSLRRRGELRGAGRCLAWSPDGRRLATGDAAAVLVHDVVHGLTRRLDGHDGPVSAAAWSPDGRWLATASHDGTVRTWDVATDAVPAVLRAGPGRAYAVAWSPDGERIASGGEDGVIHLWDAVTHDEVLPLRGHSAYVHSLAFSPDGDELLSGSGDFTVRLWSVLPLRDLGVARAESARLRAEVAPLVDDLLATLPDADAVSGRLRADVSLTPPARAAALRVLLARAMAADVSASASAPAAFASGPP
jgi:WD40 repeat protein